MLYELQRHEDKEALANVAIWMG